MALTFNQVKPTTVSQEQVPAPKNETGMANVTIRVDADCFLLENLWKKSKLWQTKSKKHNFR